MPGSGAIPVRKRAGQRNVRISLQSAGPVKDVIGGQTTGQFVEFGTDDAAIEETPFVVDASEHGITYKVTIKYRTDVITEFRSTSPKKRVRVVTTDEEGLTLTVLEIQNPERGRSIELVLHCVAAT
jgi:head-tail adaptor